MTPRGMLFDTRPELPCHHRQPSAGVANSKPVLNLRPDFGPIEWKEVTSEAPCPSCGRPDWVSRSADGAFIICRLPSTGAEGRLKTDKNGASYLVIRADQGERRSLVTGDLPPLLPVPAADEDTRDRIY